jgi:hypothetical protein
MAVGPSTAPQAVEKQVFQQPAMEALNNSILDFSEHGKRKTCPCNMKKGFPSFSMTCGH